MQIISMEEQSFYALIDKVLEEMKQKFGEQPLEWIHESAAMEILNIRSKTTLQKLRDHDIIRFTQPSRKIILYHRPSLLEYLESKANK